MKSYRFLARAGGYLFKADLEALDDEEAQVRFVKCIKEGDYKLSKESTCDPKLLLVTFEEVKNG